MNSSKIQYETVFLYITIRNYFVIVLFEGIKFSCVTKKSGFVDWAKSGLDTKKSGFCGLEKVDWTRKKVDGSGLKKWIGHEKKWMEVD